MALALLTQLVPGTITDAWAYTNLSAAQVQSMRENGTAGTILDVREYTEYCTGHIPCSVNYPWNSGSLLLHYPELDPQAQYIVVCASGNRSAAASAFLESQGFTKIYNMSGGMGSWQGETQPCGGECPALYFPHIATSIPWQTGIAIVNTAEQTVSGTLRFLSDRGQLVATKPVVLSGHSRIQITVADEFTNHTNIAYTIFDADSTSVLGYTKFSREGYYRVAIPAVKSVNTSDISLPHIAMNADWWTGVSLVNTTALPKVLTVTFNDGRTGQIALAAHEHRAFDIAQEFFDNRPQPDIQSAVITNAGGVIGLVLFGSAGWGTQLEGVLLTDRTTSTIYYPHAPGMNGGPASWRITLPSRPVR
ncbi:MAG: rhodanese-like domain-containing protein [Syntrophales bacterium]